MEEIPEICYQLGKDMDRLIEVFGKDKALAKSLPRQDRKSYVSPYAKFDRIRRKRSLLAMLAGYAVAASQYDECFRHCPDPIYVSNGGNGFSDKVPKAVDSRQLREFSIKGYKIMAYSKKDAITRLKHLKKI
jgi:hypothetical protein